MNSMSLIRLISNLLRQRHRETDNELASDKTNLKILTYKKMIPNIMNRQDLDRKGCKGTK